MKDLNAGNENRNRIENKSKIAISVTADEALVRMMGGVNLGFKGGRVSKHDLASWILLQFERKYFDGSVEAIRAEHFDQVAYLDSLVKELKRDGRAGHSPIPGIEALLKPVKSKRGVGSKSLTTTK